LLRLVNVVSVHAVSKLTLENCALLGYYAANGSNFLPTFRDKLSASSSGVKYPPIMKRNFHCHIHESHFFGFLPLKMGLIGCPETSVRNYYSMRNKPEERSSHLLRGGSLKSDMLMLSFSAGGRKRVAAFRVFRTNVLLLNLLEPEFYI